MKELEFSKKGELRTRREMLIGTLFLGAACVTAARIPNRPLDYLGNRKLEDVIPPVVGRWKFAGSSGFVLPTEDELALALYSQQLTRVYSDGASAPVMLLIAAGNKQTGFLQVHRPEVCYLANGFQLGPIEPQRVPLAGGKEIMANHLRAERDGQTEWLLYWTRVGTQIPASWAQQRLAIAKDNLRRIIPDAILIRTSMITQDEEEATRALAEFIEALVASVAPSLRRAFVT